MTMGRYAAGDKGENGAVVDRSMDRVNYRIHRESHSSLSTWLISNGSKSQIQ